MQKSHYQALGLLPLMARGMHLRFVIITLWPPFLLIMVFLTFLLANSSPIFLLQTFTKKYLSRALGYHLSTMFYAPNLRLNPTNSPPPQGAMAVLPAWGLVYRG